MHCQFNGNSNKQEVSCKKERYIWDEWLAIEIGCPFEYDN